MTDEVDDRRDDGFRPRPSWWQAAGTRDLQDTARDERADRRDDAADARDRVAEKLEVDAVVRERDAADLTIRAHERLDTQVRHHADPLANAERLQRDEDALERIRKVLYAEPELAEAFERVIEHLEELYVELVASGFHADTAQDELRAIAHLLAGAAADRRAAEHDRILARADRSSAKIDRDNARSSRQQSALDRAPRSNDVD